MNFKKFLEENIPGIHLDKFFGSFVSTSFSGSEVIKGDTNSVGNLSGIDMILPDIRLDLPTMRKTGKIIDFNWRTNPCKITLSDGTIIRMDYSKLKRIQNINMKELEKVKGKLMTVEFRRHPLDKRHKSSSIVKAILH